MNLETFSKQFLIKINNYDSIIIYRHKSPDGDALGSQFGLGEWLKRNFSNKKIYYVGECKV